MSPGPLAEPFELRPGLTFEKVLATVKAVPAAGSVASTERVLLDTFDGRLHRRGLTLWKEAKRGRSEVQLTLDGAAPQSLAGRAVPSRAGRLLVTDLAPGALRDAVADVVEERALLDLARVRVRDRRYEIRNSDAKTVVRLLVEDAAAVRPDRQSLPLAPRLYLRPVLGYGRDHDQAAVRLRKAGARPARTTMVDEALSVLGVPPEGISSEVDVPLDKAMTAERAMRAICRRLAEIVEVNLAGVVDDVDPEFLHDLRVAVRRSRSVLREMAGVLPAPATERSRSDLRWIQEVSGPTRDLDVMLLDWPLMECHVPASMRPDLDPLRQLLAAERQVEFRRMRRHLRSRRFAEAWAAWRCTLDDLDGPPGSDSAKPIGALAGRRIVAVYHKMVEMGAAIDDASPPEALHDLRKRGKELRYLLELFGGIWPAETVKPLVSALKTLQDTLGHFQDDEIQIRELRSLGPRLAALPGGTDSLIALGFVIDELATNQAAGRADFARRFATFAGAPNRKLVTTTFGPGRAGKARR